jgi:hypothetical protein
MEEFLKTNDSSILHKYQNFEKLKPVKLSDISAPKYIKKIKIKSDTNNYPVKINGYKNTDKTLSDDKYILALSKISMSLPYLIKNIHFTKDKPENHNIFISNIKNDYAYRFDGKKWNIEEKTEVIDAIMIDM